MRQKTAYLGLFAATAIILGYVESLLPVFVGIPGIKLGLANLAVLFLLQKYTWKEAAAVSVVRIFVIGFLFGNLFSILYSLAGACLSLTVMNIFLKRTAFSLSGISVAGGVAHNIGHTTTNTSNNTEAVFDYYYNTDTKYWAYESDY